MQGLSICVRLLCEIGTEVFSFVWSKYDTKVLGYSNLKDRMTEWNSWFLKSSCYLLGTLLR